MMVKLAILTGIMIIYVHYKPTTQKEIKNVLMNE